MVLHREVERFGSALVPDFQQFYGLSLLDAVDNRNPVEVVLLIAGLPETSRYVGRLVGERTGGGWSAQDWLALDIRNILEGVRTQVTGALSGKKGVKFREWSLYPGKEQERRKRQNQAMAKLRAMAWPDQT